MILASACATGLAHSPIFEPGKSIPISRFVECTSADSLISFCVLDDVLNLIGNNVQALWRDSLGSVRPFPAESLAINIPQLQVALHAHAKGDYVIVTAAMQNELPVTTHWDQSLNTGLGGCRQGATDSIGAIHLNPETGGVEEVARHVNAGSGELYYNVQSYSLFGPGVIAPLYDSYCGELYSVYAVDNKAALALSDNVLADKGYPVVFHNSISSLKSNIPAAQIVNNIPVLIDQDKGSLMTVVLPPFWTPTPQKPYPILINSHYDINDNTYCGNGLPIAECLCNPDMVRRGGAIGILWNGGGSYATFTVAPSVYDLAALMFDMVADSFGGDKNNIVAFGQSRGGVAALALAGNPYHDSYGIKYVYSVDAPKEFGDNLYLTSPFSCVGAAMALSIITGSKYGWRPVWIDPRSGANSRDQAAYNLFGIDTRALPLQGRVDTVNNSSPFGDRWMEKLRERGTYVQITSGTHDIYSHFSTELDFVNKLRAYGIPTKFEIGLGAGHTVFTSMSSVVNKMLLCALGDPMDDTAFSGAAGPPITLGRDSSGVYVPYAPAHFPFFFEGPRYAWRGYEASFCIVGEPGYDYRLMVTKIDDSIWTNENGIVPRASSMAVVAGRLPDSTSPASARASLMLQSTLDSGAYVYSFGYKAPASTTWIDIQTTSVSNPNLGSIGVLQIMGGDAAAVSSATLSANLNKNSANVAWGLCEWKDDQPTGAPPQRGARDDPHKAGIVSRTARRAIVVAGSPPASSAMLFDIQGRMVGAFRSDAVGRIMIDHLPHAMKVYALVNGDRQGSLVRKMIAY